MHRTLKMGTESTKLNYSAIEIFNNDTTNMEHVVALFEAAFGYDHSKAFELMLAVHKDRSAIIAVFDGQFERDMIERFRLLNDALPNPIGYAIIKDANDDPSLLINAQDVLTQEMPDFPPETIDWERVMNVTTGLFLILVVGSLIYFLRR